MNGCKIFFFIFFIISVNIQNVSSSNVSGMGFDMFNKNTKTIHSTMNKVFTSLKLKKTFKESTKIRLLLTMHKNLMNLIENNYKNIEVSNTYDNTPIKEFSKNDLLDGILEEEYLQLFFSSNETVQHDSRSSTLNDSISQHMTDHLKEFLIKIDNITSHNHKTIDDIGNNNSTLPNNETIARRFGRRTLQQNLKAWVPDADQSFAFNRRIYRSKTTTNKKYPFIASVHISDEYVCAGSIISKELVITAASCLQIAYLNRHNKNYQINITVRLGSDFINQGGEYVPISLIYFYPTYDPETLKHNLAIMRMDKHKHFSKKNKIRRVLFDKTSDDLPSDVKRVTIVGWGAKDEEPQQEDTTKLALAHLDLYDLEECKAVYSKRYVTEYNFCAGFISKGSGACSKDVGDPAVVAGVLIGVVSFGPPLCGTPDAPTVFTRLGLYADWIERILKMGRTTMNKLYQRNRDFTSRKPRESELGRKGVNGLGQIRLDFPEEFFVLQEILTDIATSNNTSIKDAIDEGFNKEFMEFINVPPKITLKQHPLANKSIYGISGASIPQGKYINKDLPTTTKEYGFTMPNNGLVFTDFEDFHKLGEMIDVLYEYHQQASNQPSISKPSSIIQKTKNAKNWIGRIGSKTSNDMVNRLMKTTPIFGSLPSVMSSENYDGAGSDDGMSIEVIKTTMKPTDKTTKIIFGSDSNYDDYHDVKTTTSAPADTDDYRNIFFVLENTVDVSYKPNKNSKKNQTAEQYYNNDNGRTKITSEDEDYTAENESSNESQKYIAIANRNFRYDSIANKVTKV